MSQDRNFDTEQRCSYGFTEKWLVTLIVWVGNQGNAGWKKFRSSGFQEDLAVWTIEANAVISARLFAVFQFGLGNRGAEGDIPKGWCHRLVGLAAFQIV